MDTHTQSIPAFNSHHVTISEFLTGLHTRPAPTELLHTSLERSGGFASPLLGWTTTADHNGEKEDFVREMRSSWQEGRAAGMWATKQAWNRAGNGKGYKHSEPIARDECPPPPKGSMTSLTTTPTWGLSVQMSALTGPFLLQTTTPGPVVNICNLRTGEV